MSTTNSTMAEAARRILGLLADAWNAADGQAFAEPFTADADFVAIRGDHHQGRDAIAHGHQVIFDSIYRGSQQQYEVLQARLLTDDVLLVHARATLTAPTGPMAGVSQSTATLVLLNQASEWRIAAFHNTLVAPQQEGGGRPSE